MVRVRHDRPALHRLLARDRRGVGRRAAAREARDRGRRSCAWAPGCDDTTDVGPLINPAAVEKVGSYIDIGRKRGRARPRRRGRDRRRPRVRQLLLADDLRRRQADGSGRAGGDLRARPVGHPGRRLRGRDDRAQPDPLRPVVVDLHARREHGLPSDARLRDRASSTSTPARPAPRRTSRSAAGRRPATAIARPATPRSTRSPSGSRSTSTSAAASSAPRSTTRSNSDRHVASPRLSCQGNVAA